jgi:ACS family tartrate transporter-like MFS transporter
MPDVSSASAEIERATVSKVFWRIIPLCFVLYIISYVDRANIGYAALQMNKELALSAEAFGFAAGIFFVGYVIFEVPSNVMLLRFGARIWIARILISWGVIAVLSAFVQNAWQLYLTRFLLGVAVLVQGEQATTVAYFTAAIPVSYLLGAPLSTWIMDHVSGFGLTGWRWMIVLEGVPAILGGFICLLFLTDRPDQAKWLKPAERDWLMGQLEKDRAARSGVKHLGTMKAITNPKVLYLSIIYFIYQCGSLGVGYWMPQIIKAFSNTLSNFQVGLIAMVPYAVATVAMVLWSRHSDQTGERQNHTALPLLLAAVTLGAVVLTDSPAISIALISAALAGLYAFKSPFWSLPGLFLSRETAAVSIAAINSVGNIGGFVGPYAIGLIKGWTGSQNGGLLFLAALVLISFGMTWVVRLEEARTEPGVRAQAHA